MKLAQKQWSQVLTASYSHFLFQIEILAEKSRTPQMYRNQSANPDIKFSRFEKRPDSKPFYMPMEIRRKVKQFKNNIKKIKGSHSRQKGITGVAHYNRSINDNNSSVFSSMK